MTRPATCQFSTQNLLHNLGVIRATAPHAKLLAMVKANAYGHGLVEVAQRLDGKVNALGVASSEEALALRHAGVRAPIVLIEGVFSAGELRQAADRGFEPVFHHKSQLQWLRDCALPSPLKAWIKIDSGMGRLGFRPDEFPAALQALSSSAAIRQPVGVLSHFACADEAGHKLNGRQIETFDSLTKEHRGPKSLCNSAGIFNFPECHHDWVRPGLALYGASPVAGRTAESFDLKPVMTFRTRLISVKNLRRGDSIGYGARYVCPEDMPVGILAVGYGDGYPRSAREGTPVLIGSAHCPIAGRVSMDMTAVDLRPCPGAAVGADVTLWGEGLPVEEVAVTTAHINYDLLTGLQARPAGIWS